LGRYARELSETESEAAELTRQILKLLDAGIDASTVPGEWFEWEGDKSEKDHEALRFYHLGVQWTPDWHQLWIKLFACSSLASDDRAHAMPRNMPVEKARRVLHFSRDALRRDLKRPKRWVIRRWIAGVEQFRVYFGNDQTVQNELKFYAQELSHHNVCS
jgi:hypothetical protein